MAEYPEPESSAEFQQSIYDQVNGPGRGRPPMARGHPAPYQGRLAYEHPVPHQERPACEHPAVHQGRSAYEHPVPHQGRPAYDHLAPSKEGLTYPPRQSGAQQYDQLGRPVAQVAGVDINRPYGGPSGELDPRIEEVNETEDVGIYGSIKTKIVNWLIDTKSKEEHSLYIQRA